jgi:hypothetical protein
LNLHDFALEPKIRTAAQILLDYVMVKFAVSSTRQRRIGPFRRKQENTNHPATERNELLRESHGNDQLIGLFLPYVGLTDRDGKPADRFPEKWADVALISGLAAYRPPPAAYSLAMTRYAPVQHIFSHGARPRLRGSPDIADGGVEIYYRSPSFQLTAGGMFLNSGYGHDEVEFGEHKAWKETARAQAVTLLPTRAMDLPDKPYRDVSFADLFRFEPWPDAWTPPSGETPIKGEAVNTAVHVGFACGANLSVPDKWLQIAGANWEGAWLFLDLNRQLLDYGPLGFYVAIYRTPVAHSDEDAAVPDNLGLLFAMEAGGMDFATFRQRTLDRNSSLPPQLSLGSISTFNTADDRHFGFRLWPTTKKYSGRIVSLNSGEAPADDQVEDLGALPLVDGRYLSARNGHDGFIEIRSPVCDTPVVLDFRNALDPQYLDNIAACPQPWIDRAEALLSYSRLLANANKFNDAATALLDGILIYQRLVQIDRAKYQPRLADFFFRVLYNYGGGLSQATATALDVAKQGLVVYEELAGLRTAGSNTPVDYDRLAAFNPNEYWDWPKLTGALHNLAYALRAAGDSIAGTAAMRNRVNVADRLVKTDPGKWQAELDLAQKQAAAYGN